MGAGPIYTAATHAVLSGKARQSLEEAPIEQVVVTNTVPIPEETPLRQAEGALDAPR